MSIKKLGKISKRLVAELIMSDGYPSVHAINPDYFEDLNDEYGKLYEKYDDLIDCYDNWFIYVRGWGSRIAVGGETGYWLWSRVAWNAVKDVAEECFNRVNKRKYSFQQVVDLIESNFEASLKATMKYLKKLEDKKQDINNDIIYKM